MRKSLLLFIALVCCSAVVRAEPMSYRTVTVDGLKIFYREAGPADAPVILLLHGFPTSSRMYQGLMPLLVYAAPNWTPKVSTPQSR